MVSRFVRPCGLTLVAIGLAAAEAVTVLNAYLVDDASMAPTIHPGDTVISGSEPGPPHRGEVIVFRQDSATASFIFVKRVVGLPGDKIGLKAGVVSVNGVPAKYTMVKSSSSLVDETLPDQTTTHRLILSDREGVFGNVRVRRVAPGELFVLSDNRDVGTDSRWPEFGKVHLKDIIGRARVIYDSQDKSRLGQAIE